MATKNLSSIALVTSGDLRTKVEAFVNQQYQECYGSVPYSFPRTLFGAWDGESVIGSIAWVDNDDTPPLSVKGVYIFAEGVAPWPFSVEQTIRYTCWTATAPLVSSLLALAATQYALTQGKVHGLCEAIPAVASRLRGLGIELRKVDGARLDFSQIPPLVQPYYIRPQGPGLYMMLLTQVCEALEEH